VEILKIVSEKKFPIALHLVAFLLICCAVYLNYLKTPLDNRNTVLTIEVPRGSNFSRIMDILGEAGLVKNRLAFYIFAKLKDAPTHIRAGEYELSSSMSPSLIIDKLIRGEIKGYHVPIPEGFTVSQIASTLAERGLVNKKEFLRLSVDPVFLSSLNIQGRSLEGFLFPDTYIFTKSMNEREIITLMVNQFWKKIKPEIIQKVEERGWTLNQLLTMASMIEKEAKIKEEKALISAVFHNRLKNSMRLQCDPTAVYGLEGFNGIITREHLKNNSSYNTYKINGLPPGPIANPGLDSILAALYPAQVDYLYFVARNDGSHQFSTSLALHNEAVAKFQLKRN